MDWETFFTQTFKHYQLIHLQYVTVYFLNHVSFQFNDIRLVFTLTGLLLLLFWVHINVAINVKFTCLSFYPSNYVRKYLKNAMELQRCKTLKKMKNEKKTPNIYDCSLIRKFSSDSVGLYLYQHRESHECKHSEMHCWQFLSIHFWPLALHCHRLLPYFHCDCRLRSSCYRLNMNDEYWCIVILQFLC